MSSLRDTIAVLRDTVEEFGGLTAALEVEEFKEGIAALWRDTSLTRLDWLLDPGQLSWVLSHDTGEGSSTWMIGRQRGKSYAALAYADAFARRHPGAIIRYAALTAKSAKAIVLPTMLQVLVGCPDDARPVISEDKGTITWPNGSVLTWAGTDNEQFDRLRGPRAHLVLLDESAFYADLESVEAALLPQLTTTAGKAIYLSTPPDSVAHPFLARYRAAQGARRAQHATIHDNPRLGAEGVARIIRTEAARLGLTPEQLVLTTFWRREYLAEIVTEETRAAMPAWTEERAKRFTLEVSRPDFFDAYTGTDNGYAPDPSAALFGYHDFANNRVVIEDELEHRFGTAASFSAEIKRKEKELYGVTRYDGTMLALEKEMAELPEFLRNKVHARAPRQPYMRVGDNDLQLLAEMASEHGLAIYPTRKDDKALAVDFVNQLIIAGRLVIHPRCVRLLTQLFSTIWNKTRTGWERTALDHGDLIDCLVYLCRNIRWNRDCRPPPADPWAFMTPKKKTGWR